MTRSVSLAGWAGATLLAAVVAGLAGCEKREKVLDIETPGVDIEVNKTQGGIEIEAKGKKREEADDTEALRVDI